MNEYLIVFDKASNERVFADKLAFIDGALVFYKLLEGYEVIRAYAPGSWVEVVKIPQKED